MGEKFEQQERRADAAMIARIDERTEHIIANQQKHDENDQERHKEVLALICTSNKRIDELERTSNRMRGGMAALGSLAAFLGVDKILDFINR